MGAERRGGEREGVVLGPGFWRRGGGVSLSRGLREGEREGWCWSFNADRWGGGGNERGGVLFFGWVGVGLFVGGVRAPCSLHMRLVHAEVAIIFAWLSPGEIGVCACAGILLDGYFAIWGR